MRYLLLTCRMAVMLMLAALALAFPVLTRAGTGSPTDTHPASGGKKLLLYAKNPATWTILKGGGSGKLVYRESNGAFTLIAAGLRSRSPYALVRYADAPPGAEILARKVSDGQGRLELTGFWHNWSKKIWLVAGEDVAGNVGAAGSLRAWRPDRYLFEEKPLGIPCQCPEPEEP